MDTIVLADEDLNLFKDSLSLPYSDNSIDLLSIRFGILKYNDLNILLDECYRTIRNKGRLIILFRDIKELCDKVNYSGITGDITNLLYINDKNNQICGINNESLTKILSTHKFKLFKESVSSDGISKQNIYKKMKGQGLDNLTFHYLAKYLQIPLKTLNYLMDNLDRIGDYEREIYLTEDEYNEKAITSLIKQLIDPLLVLEYDMPKDRILLYKKNIDCLLWDNYNYEEAVLLQTGIISDYNKWLYDYLGVDIKVISPDKLKDEDLFDAIVIDKGSEDKEMLSDKLTEYGKFIEV